MPDDAELLRQYADSGSDEAFAAFVRGRVDLVYSAAVRRTGGDAHLAQDVAQRVFCTAAQQAAAIARHPHPTAWLYETTRFTASALMRGEHRRKLREQIQGEEAQLTAGPDPQWEQLRPLIDEAIDRLGEGDRAAVLLRFFDGLAFPEIAQRLALTDTGARQRVDRAVEKLRRFLAGKGITSTAAGLAVALEGRAIGAAPAGLASMLTAGVLSTVGTVATDAGGAAAAKSLFFMSTTKALLTAVALVAIGATVYKVGQAQADEKAPRPQPASSVAVSSATSAPATKPAPSAPPTPTLSPAAPAPVGQFFLKESSASPTAFPQMSLAEVLQPNNLFYDALFGVSVTYPQGWKVVDARRWGTNNRENTVHLAPETESTAATGMYYQMYPGAGPAAAGSETWFRNVAQKKEDSQIAAGLSDYKNVPSSFEFKEIGGHPALSYFAVFTQGGQVQTEYFVRILGQKGYVMFTTRGLLDDVRPIMPHVAQMAATVQVP